MSESNLTKPEIENLFERICSMNELRLAFKAVKRNQGAPGVDGVTIEIFEQNLEEELQKLKRQLESWKYQPKPVRGTEIPKPGGGKRPLGIPTVRDRVVHTAIKQVLEPILDPQFSESSYGYRPGRNQRQALEAAQKKVQNGKEHVVDIDLSQFFDRIHHDRLIGRLSKQIADKRILRLIAMMLRSGIMKEGLVRATHEGSVQGSPLSPLLSNVVLDELDKELESRGLEFCRWADDCNIFVGSAKAAQRVMKSVTQFIEKKLKLVVNRQKSKVALSRQVKFLAMTIVAGTLAISQKAMAKAIDKVREFTPPRTHLSMEETMQEINQWYRGWSSYFKMTQYPSQLALIEAHIRRRLRSRIVSQQKRKRHLFNKLVKRGVSRSLARNVFSNKKRWALSHIRAVERAFPNSWFIKTLRQFTQSNQTQPHWFNSRVCIKLT